MDGNKKQSAKTATKSRKTTPAVAKPAREAKQFLVAFGNRLRELREKEGMSQGQLAYETGISRTTINRIEKGHYETGITNIFILAKALGVEEADLINFKKNQATSHV